MSKSLALITFLTFTLFLAPCDAASRSASFSNVEMSIINRNQTLRNLARTNPKAARQVLDLMQRNQIGSRSVTSSGVGSLQSRDGPASDPDFDELERSNPEAARDLFLLIKRVATEKNKK